MGNEPLVEVLSEQAAINARGGQPWPMKLREVVFAAPDVSKTEFSMLGGKLGPFLKGGATLYASGRDLALGVSSKVVNLHDRAGFVPSGGSPVIVPGVETIDMTAASWLFSLNHSTFSERRQIIEDLELLLKDGKRPPDERYRVFKPVNSNGGRFWRYVQ
jgi:esterase/lipase superfamily enzyme